MNSFQRFASLFLISALLFVALLAASIQNPAMVEARPGPTKTPTPVFQPGLLTCPNATTLEALVTCITAQIPPTGSNGFVIPGAAARTDYKNVVKQMLSGQCAGFALPASLAGAYQVKPFVDQGDGRTYCVLMEVADVNGDGLVDKAWGTFIVNPSPTRPQLNIDAPHVWTDMDTETEAVTIFKGTGARSYKLAGALRSTNSAISTCNSAYYESDAAHNLATQFQAAAEGLVEFYNGQDFIVLQFHGLGSTLCRKSSVFMTYGVDVPPAPGDKIVALKNNLMQRNPTWLVTVPGDTPTCDYGGWSNTEGRLINGVAPANVCTQNPSGYSGKWIHIEQHSSYRNPLDWIQAINITWP